MNDVGGWFAGLATIGGFAYFMLGFISAYAVHCSYQKMKHRAISIPWHLAGIAIGTFAIIVVTIQSSTAYNTAKDTAVEVQECQAQFNSTLRERARINDENDRWSQVQRKALGDWIKLIIAPPPDILARRLNNPNDPTYQKWAIDITQHYSDIIQQAQHEQDASLKERAAHPLPEPTCGR